MIDMLALRGRRSSPRSSAGVPIISDAHPTISIMSLPIDMSIIVGHGAITGSTSTSISTRHADRSASGCQHPAAAGRGVSLAMRR